MLQEPPNAIVQWLATYWPFIGSLLAASWLGFLVKGIFGRKAAVAKANKTDTETAGLDIENEQKRLEKYITAKDVMGQLLLSNEGLTAQVNSLQSTVREAREEFNRARSDIESRSAVIKYQQDENRWLIEREAKFYETIAKAETHNKECQEQLARQHNRITELERRDEQRTEAGLRVVNTNEENRSSG